MRWSPPIQSIDSATDYVLVGSFGYVHYEGEGTIGNHQQMITSAL
jgi:hypothetical protein